MIIWIAVLTVILFLWSALMVFGRWLAIRDVLQKVDVIVCLAGTRGRLETLHERLDTARELFKKGYAGRIIVSGALSGKVKDSARVLFPEREIDQYVQQGRVPKSSRQFTLSYWDKGLGAEYMCEYLINSGIEKDCIIIEKESLTTRENAKFVSRILQSNGYKSILLVTSPFHQRRAFEYFQEELLTSGTKILNYPASSKEWHPLFWWASWKNIHGVYREVTAHFIWNKK